MIIRTYEPEKDREAARRIYREVGWLQPGQEESAEQLMSVCRVMVGEVDGDAEALAQTTPGTLRYLDDNLTFSAVAAVATSRIARQQGLALRVTARVVAEDAAEGAHMAGLGMFDQGYYNRIGFGSGGYEHSVRFDPSQLVLDVKPRVPRRVTADDWEAAHAARVAGMRPHGSCTLLPAETTRAEMGWTRNGFGLGYADGPGGAISHYIWCGTDNVEEGPYRVAWMAYRSYDELLELLALLRTLADQVTTISMHEPAGIQLQDLMHRPYRHQRITRGTDHAVGIRSEAWWQMRICNLPGALEHTRLPGSDSVRFNLRLSDPIERYLGEDAPWRGVAGDYVVTLGPSSGAEMGRDETLPMLEATVNAFTRMWLGVRPATGLAATDRLSGPTELLQRLDVVLRLPEPRLDWEF
jgi:predicted acetyltransferase